MFKGKDAQMVFDESGDWTSLACYYTLHDRVARAEAHVAYLQAENERLRLALYDVKRAWLAQNAMDIIAIVDKELDKQP
jgi:hypothetical protein